MQEELLIKSRERVQALGEVFTPKWVVDFMLDNVGELRGLKILEPSVGEGAFLVEILRRKLAVVAENFFRLSPTRPPTISKNFQDTLIADDTSARAESSEDFREALIASDAPARPESSEDFQEALTVSDAPTHAESSKDFQEALTVSDAPAHAESSGDFQEAMLSELETIYGIELDGENIKVARRKMLEAFCECYRQAFEVELEEYSELCIAAQNIIHSHIIEADAIEVFAEMFEPLGPVGLLFEERKFEMSGIKFDFIIGNPPYQEDKDENSDNKNYAKPIYHKFLEESYKVCDKVMMIHPARCLFNAGATPKDFNQRMLSDEHLKVIKYEPDASKIFKGVDIKGGVAITYRDHDKNFGAIGTFIPFEELKSIHQKVVVDNKEFKSLNEIIYTPVAYRLSEAFFKERADLISKLQKPDDSALRSNIFTRLAAILFDDKPNDDQEYIQILGRQDNERVYKWILRKYVTSDGLIDKFKVFINESNATGAFGEVLTMPFVVEPGVGSTQTFISIGAFDNSNEAENVLKYLKSRFARTLLGILKVTQHNPPATWAKVPLQDFTTHSDINWSQSIKAIDQQLYQKYNLSQEEINFIETKVKEME